MKYPLADEYHQALQNPIQCFSDYQLRYGSIQADALGLPRVRSGNFASVYRVYSADGDYAVKCFLNPPDDLDHRYECITRYLETPGAARPLRQEVAPPMTPGVAPPGHFIKFKYYRKGIAVNGGVFPLLKMEWLDAVSLDKHIGALAECGNRQAILDLRDKFVGLCASLRACGISHGDLQHGNILAADDGLRLIDYDGMYVPGIRLGHAPDVGHPNYQHPKRRPADYNELSDGFSALVIYTALSILAYDPGFWRKFYNGDNILFTERDFLNTNQSPLFRRIREIPIDAIREAANVLAYSCLRPFAQMPDVMEIIADKESEQVLAAPESAGAVGGRERFISPWIKSFEDSGAHVSNVGAQGRTLRSMPAGRSGAAPDSARQMSAITCPSCRSANDDSAALCSRCAYPLSMSAAAANEAASPDYLPSAAEEEVVCPQCGALNEQSLAFCKMCGRILGGGSYDTPPAAVSRDSGDSRQMSALDKFKWTVIYFVLFFFFISAMDYARNERIGPFAPKPEIKTAPEIKAVGVRPPASTAEPLSAPSASPRETAVAVPPADAAAAAPPPSRSASKPAERPRPLDDLRKLLGGRGVGPESK